MDVMKEYYVGSAPLEMTSFRECVKMKCSHVFLSEQNIPSQYFEEEWFSMSPDQYLSFNYHYIVRFFVSLVVCKDIWEVLMCHLPPPLGELYQTILMRVVWVQSELQKLISHFPSLMMPAQSYKISRRYNNINLFFFSLFINPDIWTFDYWY